MHLNNNLNISSKTGANVPVRINMQRSKTNTSDTKRTLIHKTNHGENIKVTLLIDKLQPQYNHTIKQSRNKDQFKTEMSTLTTFPKESSSDRQLEKYTIVKRKYRDL